ncbi:MAG TPA: GYF domain-containing protein [Luteolibacter sp.]
MTHWFYGENGLQFGPVDDAGIRQLIASGRVTPATLVWREGMTEWLPLARVPELSRSIVPYGPYYASPPTSGLAIASMVCGLVGFLLCYFCALLGIPAVICGHMALKQMNESSLPMSGRGMALTGLILGYLWIGLSLLAIFAIAFGAISSMR